MTNITLKRVGLVLVLLASFAGTTTAYAQSRFQVNSYTTPDDARQRGGQDRRDEDAQRQARDRRDNYGAAARQDQGRRDPRLSPDERRDLRRQIDEAGRDIYAPRR